MKAIAYIICTWMKSEINQEPPLELLKLQYIYICMNVQILTVNSMHL